mgnify:FL=1
MTTEQGDSLGNTAQFPPYGLSTAPAAAALRIMRYCPYVMSLQIVRNDITKMGVDAVGIA